MVRYVLQALNYGKVETLTYGGKTFESAIRKAASVAPVYLTKVGLAGDEQAYKDHGGEDKALCLYPYDYYPYWKDIVKDPPETALFGENLTCVGLTEEKGHVGDVYAFGEAVIQISEPRNPCYKLAAKYAVPDMVLRMRDTGFTGFLFRVLKEGYVSSEDVLLLMEKGDVSIAEVNEVKFHDRYNKEKLKRVLASEPLAESTKVPLRKQLTKAESMA
ncbi:MOSC domain-containing protein [Halobacillus sp. ACCC02827]|uniref:MOSC domain-containing protein n=1 Tax=Halobacillus sp. ACCC02827 TaxID=3052090 RepID=UPI0025703309|nr:MOSC domain-containing protein [Halobacillus sp. ACCC02827]WJE17016.1 MOSC domain-containing protein [Halobacillus sp. ACCC02827]